MSTVARHKFRSRLQRHTFALDDVYQGPIDTIRVLIDEVNCKGQPFEIQEISIWELFPSSPPALRTLASPSSLLPNGHLRATTSDFDDNSLHARTLQEGAVMTVGGYGIATVKFPDRRYTRNLLTGEESWEDFYHEAERELQVGGGAFDLSLDIVVGAARPRRSGASSFQYAGVAMAAFISAIMGTGMLVL